MVIKIKNIKLICADSKKFLNKINLCDNRQNKNVSI